MFPLIRAVIIYNVVNNIVNALNPTEISTSGGDEDSISNFRSNQVELSIPEIDSKSSRTIKHEFLFKTDNESESREINPNYDLKKSGTTYSLNFKDDVKCAEVECRKCRTIWRSKPNPHSSSNSTKDLSNLDFYLNDSDLISHDFIIKTEDHKIPSNEIDYNYDMKKFGSTYALNFKNDVTCFEVKYCTISTIWKKDPDAYWKRSPRSISYNTKNERTFVRFYGDNFNENSTDQSNVFESASFPDYELSNYTAELSNNYSPTSQHTSEDQNSLNTGTPETCVSPDICNAPDQNELDSSAALSAGYTQVNWVMA
nr:hypothetical protein MACL_00002230 [Theileria orientalis]